MTRRPDPASSQDPGEPATARQRAGHSGTHRSGPASDRLEAPEPVDGASWSRRCGAPSPLGVAWLEAEDSYNFALYSKHATSVTLLLFAQDDLEAPAHEVALDPRWNRTGRVWHCRVVADAVESATYYAYRVGGPPPQGRHERHAFDPEKVLLDPYARAVFFPPAFSRAAACAPGSNAGKAPLGVLRAVERTFDWGDDRRPRHESDAVIYEVHVRGFTASPSSGVSPELRGTYAGLVEKIPYLRELGVTVVELMPVFQFDPEEGNYWGYDPLNFFAPHHAYATSASSCLQHCEFKDMVKALHAAGIEVVLDVVFNHTGEGNHLGPTYSFKGIDNSSYYLATGDPRDPYANFSGCGNTLHCSNRHVRTMIVDSLRHWATEMRVDGFRFDLASIFVRDRSGELDPGAPSVLDDLGAHPELADLRLIAEPWDAGGGYLLGRRFPGLTWGQWNDRFRDDVRRFVRGDEGLVGALMQRLYGSDDVFPDATLEGCHPYQSVNYVTSHDGFTLYDQLSYERKRNWANGHDNRDGPPESFSTNCGHEGDGPDIPAEVLALRKRQAKNFACLLLLANGTPMLRAGDEFLHTQGGNDNPYNQDNPTTWLDWSRLKHHRDVFRFFKLMIALRKRLPSLCPGRFWRDRVRWFGVGPAPDLSRASHSVAFFLDGRPSGCADVYVMVNAYSRPLSFGVQVGEPGDWREVVNTGREPPEEIRALEDGVPVRERSVLVGDHAVVVLARSPSG